MENKTKNGRSKEGNINRANAINSFFKPQWQSKQIKHTKKNKKGKLETVIYSACVCWCLVYTVQRFSLPAEM
jgi:hypothetical protein